MDRSQCYRLRLFRLSIITEADAMLCMILRPNASVETYRMQHGLPASIQYCVRVEEWVFPASTANSCCNAANTKSTLCADWTENYIVPSWHWFPICCSLVCIKRNVIIQKLLQGQISTLTSTKFSPSPCYRSSAVRRAMESVKSKVVWMRVWPYIIMDTCMIDKI